MAVKAKLDPIAKFELDNHKKNYQDPRRPISSSIRKLIAKHHIDRDEIPQELLAYQPTNTNFHPTEQQKRMVWQMGAMGATVDIIRLAIIDPDTCLPISQTTFQANFLHILKHAREQANIKISLKIFELALGQEAEYDADGHIIRPYTPPNLDALKWWDRTRNPEVRSMFGIKNVINSVVDGNGPVTLVIEGS